jgi:hypothetical protein
MANHSLLLLWWQQRLQHQQQQLCSTSGAVSCGAAVVGFCWCRWLSFRKVQD